MNNVILKWVASIIRTLKKRDMRGRNVQVILIVNGEKFSKVFDGSEVYIL